MVAFSKSGRVFIALGALALGVSCTPFRGTGGRHDGGDAGTDETIESSPDGATGCQMGSHDCAGQCRPDTDENFCGSACAHCSAPENGKAVCGGSCGIKCDDGFNLCGTSCKATTDPNACGPTCIVCDAPVGGSGTCDGAKCGAPTCPSGQKICNDACIDENRSCGGACSNGKYSCPDGVCRDTNTVASCGTACQQCPAKVNATATGCSNGTCAYTCSSDYFQCADGTCGRNVWDFETGDVQGWTVVPDDNQPPDTVSVSQGQKSEGKYALVTREISASEAYSVRLKVPVCNSHPTDFTGKKLTLKVLLDLATGSATAPDAYVCLSWYNNADAEKTGGCGVAMAGWTTVEQSILDLPDQVTAVGVYIMVETPGAGRLYIDDVEISN